MGEFNHTNHSHGLNLPDDHPDVNFDEILRVLDSMQLTAKHQVATLVNWKNGEHVIIVPTVSDGEVGKKYPEGFKKIKPYLRTVKQSS